MKGFIMEMNRAIVLIRICNLLLKITEHLNDDDCDKHRCICISNDDNFTDLDDEALKALELAVLEKYGIENTFE